jgi:hypothetical protein
MVDCKELVNVCAVHFTVSFKIEIECLIGKEAMGDWGIGVEKAYGIIFCQV